jgi:hypothetical protein
MWVFAGRHACAVATKSQTDSILLEVNSTSLLSNGHWAEFDRCLLLDSVMSSVKAIATFASVVAIASSIFAFSWVGLALLGF